VSEVSQSAAKATSTLPDFDPTSRAGKGEKEKRRKGDQEGFSPPSLVSSSSSPSNSESKPSSALTTNTPSTPFNWYEVKSRSSAQLKAFLMPALDEVDGFNITLRYEEKSRFHFSQIKQRQEELLALVTELFGDGYKITLVGPGESRKKS
jgi:hypothetical protein